MPVGGGHWPVGLSLGSLGALVRVGVCTGGRLSFSRKSLRSQPTTPPPKKKTKKQKNTHTPLSHFSLTCSRPNASREWTSDDAANKPYWPNPLLLRFICPPASPTECLPPCVLILPGPQASATRSSRWAEGLAAAAAGERQGQLGRDTKHSDPFSPATEKWLEGSFFFIFFIFFKGLGDKGKQN